MIIERVRSWVLVVDDDPVVRQLLVSGLGCTGFDVDVAADTTEALDRIAARAPDVIVLDVSLPEADCFGLVQLRSRSASVPVLFMTDREAVGDWVGELRLGGDDYVTKPLSVVEVADRVQALLRHVGEAVAPADGGPLRHGDLEVDDRRHTVHRSGHEIRLSPTEFRLLHLLIEHPGQVLSKAQILDAVWQYDFGGRSVVVERFISNLRRKIDDGRGSRIQTVRGVGYSLRDR